MLRHLAYQQQPCYLMYASGFIVTDVLCFYLPEVIVLYLASANFAQGVFNFPLIFQGCQLSQISNP